MVLFSELRNLGNVAFGSLGWYVFGPFIIFFYHTKLRFPFKFTFKNSAPQQQARKNPTQTDNRNYRKFFSKIRLTGRG